MYLHLGQGTVVHEGDVLGIFDLDNTTSSHLTRSFLNAAERAGEVEVLTLDLPKAFVLCGDREKQQIYLSQLSSATLKGRAEGNGLAE